MRARTITTVLLALTLVGGCAENEITFGALFAAPSGLAAGGSVTESRSLFVSNSGEDALQVLQLGPTLDAVEFVMSPAQYFPLRIPAGPSPTELITTADGRFVVVLNEASDSLGLVDADKQAQVREAAVEGEDRVPHRLVVGPEGSRPTAMVASVAPCGAGCAGLIYVTLAGIGAIAEIAVLDTGELERDANGDPVINPDNGKVIVVDLDGDDQTGELELRRLLAVGGQPLQIAISPDGDIVYAGDAASPQVIRVEVGSGAVERSDIGGIAGPIAVSQDGTLLIVGRPALRDVVVLSGADSQGFSVIDSDPLWAPLPACVSPCDDLDRCGQPAHPADATLCRTEEAEVRDQGTPYEAVFMNVAPVEIVTLATEAAGEDPLADALLSPACGSEDRPEYNQYAVIATLDGLVWFLTLRDADDQLDIGLLRDSWCEQPEIEVSGGGAFSELELADILEPCPPLPDRRRLECIGEHAVVMPGATELKYLRLIWEDVVLSREGGGGEVTADGELIDIGIDLNEENILEDDILEILTEPLIDADCTAIIGDDVALCNFERRVDRVEVREIGDEEKAFLILDRPLPPECFASGGAIAYQIRAGDQFRMVPGLLDDSNVFEPDGRHERLNPGDWIGPFGEQARDHRLTIGLLDSLDPRAGEPACERYGDAGLQAPLSRDGELIIGVDDNYDPLRLAEFGPVIGSASPTGYLPAAMIAGVAGHDQNDDGLSDGLRQAIYIAFSGSGSGRLFNEPPLEGVMAFFPHAPTTLTLENPDVMWKIE